MILTGLRDSIDTLSKYARDENFLSYREFPNPKSIDGCLPIRSIDPSLGIAARSNPSPLGVALVACL
uniref:Uncharacterized protein n=1 Tax=Panagrolaimus sp. PS1159 TaxID=55785 RepID=A0AC35G3A6_9BILA